MSDQSSNNQNQSDEIDLGVLFDKLKSFFKSILIGIVMIFQFFWNHKIRLIILLVIGVGIQLLLITKGEKIYVNEYFVRTNFGSTEYLYSKARSINSKLKSDDTLYLKKVFGKNYERVDELEVVPVVNVYNLVNKSEENREIFELLLKEYGNLEFLEEDINVNEYPTHKIKLYINGEEENESISNLLFSFLSDNSYYEELKQTALVSYKEKLEQNKTIRTQIDSIIKDQKGNNISPKLDKNGINFTGSQNLPELLAQKQGLLNNDLTLRNQLSSENEILKTIDSSFGVYDKEKTPSYIKVPLLLVGLYLLIFLMRFVSKRIMKFLES